MARDKDGPWLTPRVVERRYGIKRTELAARRTARRPPVYAVVRGCVVYREDDVETFLIGPLQEPQVTDGQAVWTSDAGNHPTA